MPDRSDAEPLDAGEFSAWLRELDGVLRGENAADVPCATCNSCCKSSQFIHIAPDEHRTLARIPTKLVFPAPGLPKGNVLLGYDQHGHCPMLKNNSCSIYEDRPRTCRAYDCRVFPATGVTVTDDAKPLIEIQISRWQFSYSDDAARAAHDATIRAASFLRDHRYELPRNAVPSNPTQLAAIAIRLRHLFDAGATPSIEQLKATIGDR